MKAETLVPLKVAPSAPDADGQELRDGERWWPVGSIIDHPDAYRLVKMGVAKPADSECTLSAGMSTDQMATAQRQQEMVAKGIHPDDYQRYLDGEILGYNAEGFDIPGPNYIEETDDE